MRPELAGEWMQKLQRYTEASEMVIRPNPKKSSEPTVAMQAEGEKVLKALRPQVSFLLFCPASHLISTFLSSEELPAKDGQPHGLPFHACLMFEISCGAGQSDCVG